MKKIYIRYSSKPCPCGGGKTPYSLLDKKIVKAIICENCFDVYIPALKSSELVFITFENNPRLPSFLRRMDEDVKSQAA